MKAFWNAKNEVYGLGIVLPFSILTAFAEAEEAIKRLDAKSAKKGLKLLNAQTIPTSATESSKPFYFSGNTSFGGTD